ncbi:Acyl carrier protein-like protein [Pseudocohnilembus persalinus]|uniref:Acyl carrier protein n=1 Tax=Pseudocohnilembus persalinus TaxID=266149 RepID=A0A0V0R0D1_PSEPJ|nr:Acyl carrier protein-like protein [Pseudocohnilembus persalinus]|eukprot:KRX07770.1 Acyl carrier protein-like protein [Pseudocohnilembus persalinus]
MFRNGLSKLFSINKQTSLLRQTNKFYFASGAEQSTATNAVQQEVKRAEKKADIQQFKDGQLITKNAIVLKKQEDIEGYVLNLLRNYFRTTNKAGLTLESNLLDHGLDSLDSIELSMQIEEDLGYVISAETLPVLNRASHYVNYIQHVEQFKAQNGGANPLA